MESSDIYKCVFAMQDHTSPFAKFFAMPTEIAQKNSKEKGLSLDDPCRLCKSKIINSQVMQAEHKEEG